MEVVPEEYPDNKFNEELAGKLQEAVVGAFEVNVEGNYPQFTGSYLERGALILSCANQQTKTWLE